MSDWVVNPEGAYAVIRDTEINGEDAAERVGSMFRHAAALGEAWSTVPDISNTLVSDLEICQDNAEGALTRIHNAVAAGRAVTGLLEQADAEMAAQAQQSANALVDQAATTATLGM